MAFPESRTALLNVTLLVAISGGLAYQTSMIEKRIEQLERRIEQSVKKMTARLEDLEKNMTARFEDFGNNMTARLDYLKQEVRAQRK